MKGKTKSILIGVSVFLFVALSIWGYHATGSWIYSEGGGNEISNSAFGFAILRRIGGSR